MTTMTAMYVEPRSIDHDASVLRQVAAGWRYAYGAGWITSPALWTECTCSPAHDDPRGCNMTCVVCEVLATLDVHERRR